MHGSLFSHQRERVIRGTVVRDLYVIRPDGSGRASLNIDGIAGGLFPDWTE